MKTLSLTLAAALLTSSAFAQTNAPAPQTTPPAAVQTPAQAAPATPAPAATPAAPAQVMSPVTWTSLSLSTASYAIQEPVWEGNPNLVSAEQRTSIMTALKNDAGNALKRRYPGATIVAANTPGAVKVTPVLTAPPALVPWAKLGLKVNYELPDGSQRSLSESFGLLTLWQQGAEAANFAYDQLAKRLP